MSAQTITLIAAGIAAVSSVITLFLNSRLTFDRERRQALLRKEIDRLFELEELAGRVLELSASYAVVETKLLRLPKLFEDLDDFAGRVARYREVQQAVRDLSQSCKILVKAMQKHEDDRSLRNELNGRHAALIGAIDGVLRTTGAKLVIRASP